MSRPISQDAFNEIVQEIINEFCISPEEAVDDAVKQLQAQGVDLTKVRKSVILNFLPQEDVQPLELAIRNLDEHMQVKAKQTKFIEDLKVLSEACEKSSAHKIFIGKSEFVRIGIDILREFPDDKDIVALVLKGLLNVTIDQPDVVKGNTAAYVMQLLLEKIEDENCLDLLLKWMKAACVKHEENRQCIVQAGCIPCLKDILEKFSDVPSIVKEVCSVLRALVLDDDIRVEYGLAHEHARMIADSTLVTIITFLERYKTEKEIVGELLLTLCAVIVRNEYCEKFLDERGETLSYILDVFVNFPDSEKLNRQCMKLLKVLAGSDQVKGEIIISGAAPLIVTAMTRHMKSALLVAAGNGCIAALTLRSAPNSKAFCEAEAPCVILEGMRTHKQDLSVQKQGCWAIRNMVSRTREICPFFLEFGAEELINHILHTLGDQCEYDAKSALRDLGCQVDLREEWTGEGGALN